MSSRVATLLSFLRALSSCRWSTRVKPLAFQFKSKTCLTFTMYRYYQYELRGFIPSLNSFRMHHHDTIMVLMLMVMRNVG